MTCAKSKSHWLRFRFKAIATRRTSPRVSANDGRAFHIAIVEALDGKTVDWLEKLADAEYRTAADSPG